MVKRIGRRTALSTLNEEYTQINIDGKVLRATAKSGHKKSGLCLLSAWVSDHKLILGQQKVASKCNEKTAVPELLKSLDLKDSIVTIDAIACAVKNADIITSKQGHYILALKNNNKHIYQKVSEIFDQVKLNYLRMNTLTLVVEELRLELVMSKMTLLFTMI